MLVVSERAVKQHKADRDLRKLLQCHPTVRHYALKVLKSTMRLVKGTTNTSWDS